VRIGIARDAAFHFYYEDNLNLLREAGAELVPFSPLADSALPRALDSLYIGGGFPEMFARTLAENVRMRESIRAFAKTGAVYAECGGLMWLGRTLTDGDGRSWEMCGALPVHTGMGKRAQRLGYVEATTLEAGLLGPKGTVLRGHEFHWSSIVREDEATAPAYAVRSARNGEIRATGLCAGQVWASYLHFHFASQPVVARNWVNHLLACRPHPKTR
jgi:cobyrinic acid a,c-diamide synthase